MYYALKDIGEASLQEGGVELSWGSPNVINEKCNAEVKRDRGGGQWERKSDNEIRLMNQHNIPGSFWIPCTPPLVTLFHQLLARSFNNASLTGRYAS